MSRTYIKQSPNYKRNINRLLNRLMMVKRILFNGNCILVSSIKEYIENGERGREVCVTTSTFYDKNSDEISLLAAADMVRKRNLNIITIYNFEK